MIFYYFYNYMKANRDNGLLKRLAQGDSSALEELYIVFAPKIRRYFTSYFGESTASDMTHDLFLKIWNSRRKFWNRTSRVENIDAYLYGMAKNAVLDRIKHLKVIHKYNEDVATLNAETSMPKVEEKIDNCREIAEIGRKIDLLTQQQRSIFYMQRILGKSYSEIAQDMGISERTVQYHISTVLCKLKKMS